MSNRFYEDETRPIVSSWLDQGFEIDRGFILEAIETDCKDLSTDTMIAGVGAFTSIASGCLMLALAGFSAPMVIPVAALVGSGLVAWNSDCSKGDRELEARFLKEYPAVFDRLAQKISSGEVVHKISAEYSQMFRSYTRHDRTALAQLTATSNPVTITPTVIQNSDASNLAQTVLEGVPNEPTPQSEIIAQTIPDPIAVSPSMQVVNGVETMAPRDIATDLGNKPQSALIFGTPGAGKGMNISNAIRTLRAKLPNVTVMMVDPKGDKKERGYWEGQVDIFESRALLKSSPRSSAEWMMRCVEKFVAIDGPKLLVWDELYATITILKAQNIAKGEESFPCLTDFQQFLSIHFSLGPSSGIWIWGMSQSANLSDLGLTSGGLSTTRIIALVSPDNVGAVEGYLATKAITAPKGGMDEIDRLMDSSPVGRACYDGKTKKWYPMAKLENHSGFDRDSADWNNLATVTPSSKTITVVPESITVPAIEPWVSDEALEPELPNGLKEYPLVLTVWEYLNGKDARTMKQIRDAMRKTERITEEDLKKKLPSIDGYNEALKSVIKFGVGRGYLKEVSDDTYEAIKTH